MFTVFIFNTLCANQLKTTVRKKNNYLERE